MDALCINVDAYRQRVVDIPSRFGFLDIELADGWMKFGKNFASMLRSAVDKHIEEAPLTPESICTFLQPHRWETTEINCGRLLRSSNPFELMRAAYQALKRRGNCGAGWHDALLLALISISAQGLLRMRICEICFRWALPGYRHCGLHSQAKQAPGTSTEKATRYRRGLKIAITFKYPPRDPPGHSTMTARRLPFLVARTLWHATLPNETRIVEGIRRELDLQHNLLFEIGEDALGLPASRLYKRLQITLDPLEINPVAWRWKIRQASRWKQHELHQCPGKRGKGLARRWKILEAVSLGRRGFSKAEIARILKVAPSSISNWLASPDGSMLADVLNSPFQR